MQIRNNVRERRRERIQQLLDEMQAKTDPGLPTVREETADIAEPAIAGRPVVPNVALRPSAHTSPIEPSISPQPRVEEPSPANAGLADESLWSSPSAPVAPPLPAVPMQAASPTMPEGEPDPELWWREKQRRMKYDDTNQWAGMRGLTPTSRAPDRRSAPGGGGASPWLRGFYARIVIAGLLLAGFYGWTKMDLPGSAQVREWAVDTVTKDMDFQAVEAWYEETFGGSPSFLSFSRKDAETKEVAAALDRKDTVAPVNGRIVQSYEQNGTGVQVAAPGGSDVVAVYAGRVLQVQAEQDDGGLTVLVEHQDRVLSVYGHLASASVKENDWVEAGDKLGALPKAADGKGGESRLYFAVQQDGNKLNPTDVVPFD